MTYTRELISEILLPSVEDTQEAKELSRILATELQNDHSLSLHILHEGGQSQDATITLPTKVAHLLRDILVLVSEGKAVTIIPTHAELTTQQAADLLNVSRPFFVHLLENQKIPFRKVGTHRRILLSDVLMYKQQTATAREQSLSELASFSQELRLDY